jgi:hypothetical protein
MVLLEATKLHVLLPLKMGLLGSRPSCRMQIALANGTLVASINDAGPGISDNYDRGQPTYVFKAGAAAWTEVQPAVRLSDHFDMVSRHVCTVIA